MEGGFPYGDIIVIGAIAAFIILRYRAMLGEKQGRDVEDITAAKPMAEYERIIQVPTRERAPVPEIKKTEQDFGVHQDQLSAMKAVDKEFSPEEFLEGAKAAFEMVMEAYNKRDHDTMKMLLSPTIYASFSASIEAEEKTGRRSESTLLAIVKAEIAAARLLGNTATIAVDFLTEQVPLVRNLSGQVVEGDPSHQEAIEDRWVFERNLASNSPDWKIIET